MVDLQKEAMVIARQIVKDSEGHINILEALPIAVQIQRNKIMLHAIEAEQCLAMEYSILEKK